MGLRFFTDHCVPSLVVSRLSEAGHQVFRLRDLIPRDSSDPEVLAKALELEAILVSMNGDFTDITTYPPEDHIGIVALQVKNHPEVIPAVLDRWLSYVSLNPNSASYAAKLFLVEPHRIRIRSRGH